MTKSKNKRALPIRASILVALILSIIKIFVGIYINSLAILSSAVDNILDVLSSTINYLALNKADMPPDLNHKYGHYKFEPLASFIQALILIVTAIYIFYKAIKKIYSKDEISDVEGGLYIMLFSLVATAALIYYLRKSAKKYKSSVYVAESLHYETDILTNIAVIITLIVIEFTDLHILDPVLSIAISIYIFYEALKLSVDTSKELLDTEISDDVKDNITSIIKSYGKHSIDYHKLRTRKAGNKIFVDVHITLCNNPTLEEAHNVITEIEHKIKEKLSNIDIMIHAEPSEDKNNRRGRYEIN